MAIAPVHALALVTVTCPCEGLSRQVMAAPSGPRLIQFCLGMHSVLFFCTLMACSGHRSPVESEEDTGTVLRILIGIRSAVLSSWIGPGAHAGTYRPQHPGPILRKPVSKSAFLSLHEQALPTIWTAAA